jgi:hypothetical protein
MTARFKDEGQTLHRFSYEFLVHCPKCNKRAHVVLLRESGVELPEPRDGYVLDAIFHPRRLVCAHCGFTQDWRGREIQSGGPCDWYFLQPVWLQTPCCGETLWAYNKEHLDFLEQYVAATLRERAHPDGPLLSQKARNLSLASRLPAWIKSAKNRDDVLRCIGKLRRMLD